MNEQEKLIEKIDDLMSKTKYLHGDCHYSRAIADFILEDRKRICQPLIKCNEILEKEGEDIGIPMFAYEYAEAIGKTLKLAGLNK